MQYLLEFGDRQIRLPEYSLKQSLDCGVIEQVIVREGKYPIIACRSNSPKRYELDLGDDCGFKTILIQEGRIRTIDTNLPCAFTNDASGLLIEASSCRFSGPDVFVKTADQPKTFSRSFFAAALRLVS